MHSYNLLSEKHGLGNQRDKTDTTFLPLDMQKHSKEEM